MIQSELAHEATRLIFWGLFDSRGVLSRGLKERPDHPGREIQAGERNAQVSRNAIAGGEEILAAHLPCGYNTFGESTDDSDGAAARHARND
jgi:hypothetical protein